MKQNFPSLDLYPLVYPLHDKDGFIEFVTGMWLHTAHLVGKPTRYEVEFTLREFPPTRRLEIVDMLQRRGQLAELPRHLASTSGRQVVAAW